MSLMHLFLFFYSDEEVSKANISDTSNNQSNLNKKSHSPTPELPPPSVTQAENTIFELIKPPSSGRTDCGFYEELRSFIWKNHEEPKAESVSSSRLSEYVEEFVSDVPFAGKLFLLFNFII